MNKITARTLSMTIVFMLIATQWQTVWAADLFADVKKDVWYAANVEWAVANKVVSGYQDGTFRPNAKITEAEFLTMLFRAADPAAIRAVGKGEAWYVPYYEIAIKAGYPLIAANRSKPINRGLAARVIAASFGQSLKTDEAIKFVLAAKLSNGKTAPTVDGYVADALLTRAEAVVFVQRVETYREKQQAETEQEDTAKEEENVVKPVDNSTTGNGTTTGGTGSTGNPGGNPGNPGGNNDPERPAGPVRTTDNLQLRTEQLQTSLTGLGLALTKTSQGAVVSHPDREGSGAVLTQNGDTTGSIQIFDDEQTKVIESAHALLQYAGVVMDKQVFMQTVERIKQNGSNTGIKIGNQMVTFVRSVTPGQIAVNYTLFGK